MLHPSVRPSHCPHKKPQESIFTKTLGREKILMASSTCTSFRSSSARWLWALSESAPAGSSTSSRSSWLWPTGAPGTVKCWAGVHSTWRVSQPAPLACVLTLEQTAQCLQPLVLRHASVARRHGWVWLAVLTGLSLPPPQVPALQQAAMHRPRVDDPRQM